MKNTIIVTSGAAIDMRQAPGSGGKIQSVIALGGGSSTGFYSATADGAVEFSTAIGFDVCFDGGTRVGDLAINCVTNAYQNCANSSYVTYSAAYQAGTDFHTSCSGGTGQKSGNPSFSMNFFTGTTTGLTATTLTDSGANFNNSIVGQFVQLTGPATTWHYTSTYSGPTAFTVFNANSDLTSGMGGSTTVPYGVGLLEPTSTMYAVDLGGTGCPSTDIWGHSRTNGDASGGSECDIGAVEKQ